MSYLDVPRIHMAGKFFTDPSTINNDPTHYDPECTRPSPWQEPEGQHRFQLRDCSIRSVVGPDGAADDDTLIGSPIISTDIPTIAKIVDLDVYQQGVPTIYGMQLQINLSDGGQITGTLDPVTLNGFWYNCVLPTRSWQDGDYFQDSYGGDMNAAGYFHTVVRFDPDKWPATSSAILTKLRAVTLTSNGKLLVSFRFVLDGYQNTPEDANFRLGRIVGTLGPVYPNEPLYNAGQRWMKPRPFAKSEPWYSPSFNDCTYKVDKQRKKLVLDLANSLCRQTAGGAPVDLGTLTAKVGYMDPPIVEIGAVDYSAFAYENNAHITELDLTDEQILAIDNAGLNLEMSRTDLGSPIILSGGSGVPDYAVEVRPVRMPGAPGTKASTQVYVSLNGEPMANKQLAIFIESVHGTTPGATVPPSNPGNTPQADGALTATITPTNQYGFATVNLEVLKDPGFRTTELDGQLYFVVVYDPAYPHTDWTKEAPVQEHLVSCLVWSDYKVNQNPTWEEIQSMFVPYMKLYPGMKNRINLTDQHTFFIFANNPPWSTIHYGQQPKDPLGITAGTIPYYLDLPFDDPGYMPVTRDLSPNKVLTTLYYIKNLQAAPSSNV